MTKEIRKESYIKFVLGSPMPNTVRLVGVVLQLVGLYHVVSQPYVSIGIILIGFFASYQMQGVEIDLATKKFRFYHSFVGYKTGKWQSLDGYPFLSVLNRKTTQRVFGMSAGYYNKEREFYSIVLMDTSHRTRFVITNVEGLEEAKTKAQELAVLLNREIVNYNPKVLNHSRGRRKR